MLLTSAVCCLEMPVSLKVTEKLLVSMHFSLKQADMIITIKESRCKHLDVTV